MDNAKACSSAKAAMSPGFMMERALYFSGKEFSAPSMKMKQKKEGNEWQFQEMRDGG